MLDQINPALAQATDHAYSIPLDQVGDGWPERFRADTFWPYFDGGLNWSAQHFILKERWSVV